ncbi:MAG TPA: hypothetical protein PLG75_11805 [Methanoculleus sp.]|mgnify:CR=1 FL=1|jgi:hypothetical protein|nr:hypothetical protein [Methanoculleus sp.]
MDLLAGLNRDLDYAERLKDGLTVGLFGSFKRSHLEALRHHLREREGFNARISYDLTASHPKEPGEDDRAYDFRLAEALIEESRVYMSISSGKRRANTASTIQPPWRSGSSTASPPPLRR